VKILARNKYPEETRQLILEVAKKLFLEKGYDGTTINDIIAGLGGLTKGVIYHHFKSKEDIFEQILESVADQTDMMIQMDQSDATGLEKIQLFLIQSLQQYEALSILYSLKVVQKSARLIGDRYLDSISTATPEVRRMLQVGIDDGSIVVEYPDEVAELLIMLLNIWLGVQLPNWNRAELKRKFMVIRRIFDSMGVALITDQTLEAVDELCDYLDTLDEKVIAE